MGILLGEGGIRASESGQIYKAGDICKQVFIWDVISAVEKKGEG